MMTAPSTMMPKSIAPRLIRLALTLVSTMPVIVNSIDSGMTQAVTIAARMLPRIRNSTAITSSAPSSRFFSTVCDGGFDQVGAVVDRPRDDAVRQRLPIVLELGGDALRDGAAVLADQQHGGAEHRLLAVERRRARAQVLALAALRRRRGPGPGCRRAMPMTMSLDFVGVADLARRADEILLAVAFDIAGADIGVVGGQRRHDVAESPSL